MDAGPLDVVLLSAAILCISWEREGEGLEGGLRGTVGGMWWEAEGWGIQVEYFLMSICKALGPAIGPETPAWTMALGR